MECFSKQMREYTLQLTRQRSVVGTKGEVLLADSIYTLLQRLPYYEQRPELLQEIFIPGDKLKRKFVIARICGGQRAPNKAGTIPAVLCLGHFDTVGLAVYGSLEDIATEPELLQAKLKQLNLPEAIAAEAASDDWLFGRGILDMKAGIAAHLVMARHFSARARKLTGDLIFLFVPDEEGDSAGMVAAVKSLAKLKAAENYDYLAALNTDYMTSYYEGDTQRYIYVGTVGKLLPCFTVFGEPAHVGEAFKGVDANYIAAEIVRQLNYNTRFCDEIDGEVTLPPVCLYQSDRRPGYSIEIAQEAVVYFNFSTCSKGPQTVMGDCLTIARTAFATVLSELSDSYKTYCSKAGLRYQPIKRQGAVMTYEELYEAVKQEQGDEIDKAIALRTKELLAEAVDDRLFSQEIVKEVHRHYSNQQAKIIVYFAPPYYAHHHLRGETGKEAKLLTALDSARKGVREAYPYDIVIKGFFPYISDMSYCGLTPNEAEITALTQNMPAWGKTYQLPVTELREITMPVANIGPFGKDAHKQWERLSTAYSFDAVPLLLKSSIENLLTGNKA